MTPFRNKNDEHSEADRDPGFSLEHVAHKAVVRVVIVVAVPTKAFDLIKDREQHFCASGHRRAGVERIEMALDNGREAVEFCLELFVSGFWIGNRFYERGCIEQINLVVILSKCVGKVFERKPRGVGVVSRSHGGLDGEGAER